jgi:hypothetical protein
MVKAFGPDGTGATDFGRIRSVAVDRELGILYALDGEESLFKYDLEGNPVDFGGSGPNISGNELSGLPLGFAGTGVLVKVSPLTHTIYVSVEGTGVKGKKILAFKPNGEESLFTAGSGAGTNVLSPAPASVQTFAVGPNGDIYIGKSGYPEGEKLAEPSVSVYAASGAEILSRIRVPTSSVDIFPFAQTLAVAKSGDLYSDFTGFLSVYRPSEYPVTANTTYKTVRSAAVGSEVGIDLDPETNELYVARSSNSLMEIAVFDEELEELGSFAGPGQDGELEGPGDLAINPGTERVFVADNSAVGFSQVKVFEPRRCVCAPAIEAPRAAEVSADSARLLARVNPNTFDTTWWFEYGLEDCETGPCTKAPLPAAAIAAGFKPVAVSQLLSGLQPKSTYHYRVVAENQLGTTEGPDKTFTTQGSGLGFKLADGRVWEMVSPPDKHGGSLKLPSTGIVQAAEDGEGIAYLSLGSIEADPEGSRAIESSSVLSRRGASGWQSKDITPPHTELTRVAPSEYLLMNTDLSNALMDARDATPLSPLTTERTPYVRENTEPPTYIPLLTGAEGYANVPPGTEFGGAGDVEIAGASPDLGTVLLYSEPRLVEGASSTLFTWREGQIQEIEIAEPGVPARLGSDYGSQRKAISDDGSRVFWSSGLYDNKGIETTALYLHDMASEESIRLDVVEAGVKNAGAPRPAFQIASADGTVVFFTDSRHLRKGASPEGRDLYRCEIPAGQSAGGCATLTDIAAPLKGSGESAMVKDQVLAASEDGSRVYFVAEGVLDGEANAEGDVAVAKEPNLYLWQAGEGVRFIATLSEDDRPNWGAGPGLVKGWSNDIVADASPSGRYLAFMSNRSLSGYDNETAAGDLVQEAYRYDALSGELACVSCNPTGGRPQAKLMTIDLAKGSLKVDPISLWSGQEAAAVLPEPRQENPGSTFYRPRTVLDNGRVFFNAYDSLVPADSNGNWDVYQYESTGSGDCTASTGGAATVSSGEGCVGLISSGSAEEEAAFLDASATGQDAFFLSTAKLSVLDEDVVYDVYDARVDGVAAQLPDLAECQGEACQPAVSPPDDPTPASATFRGAGNPRPEASGSRHCPKAKRAVRRKGKVRCVPRKQRKSKANHERRAGR